MVDCPEKFPLSWLNGMIDYDSTFAAEALIIRERIETYQPEHQRQTHTLASAAVGLVNHWLVQRDLNGYERGRLVDNFGELVVIPVEGCYSKGIASRQSSIFIVRDELVTLMQSHGRDVILGPDRR